MASLRKALFRRPTRACEIVAIIAISITCYTYISSRNAVTRLGELERIVTQQSQVIGMCTEDAELQKHVSPKRKEAEKFEFSYIPDADKINNTKKAKMDLVFFNRVPKVGSQMLMELARRMSVLNGFEYYSEKPVLAIPTRMDLVQQKEAIAYIQSLKQPGFYSQHVNRLNFSRFAAQSPIYVNMVRDPIERVISWFYYIRSPWYFPERKRLFPDIEFPETQWLQKDFSDCVRNDDPECRYVTGDTIFGIDSHLRQSLFFCGHDELCVPLNSEKALQVAKQSVEQDFAVVGVLEYLNETITVLENYIPKYFSGISQAYRELNSMRINRNAYKPPVSEEVKEIVRKKLPMEVEFFQFCKQRLHLQLRALRLPNS